MARTNDVAVKNILLRDYDTKNNPDLTPFIEAASGLTDDIAACAVAKGRPLSGGRLALIEGWLAAHLYSQTDRPYQEKVTLDAEATYQGETGMYLENTYYGQTARLLDTSGCLAQLDPGTGQRSAGGFWAGTAESAAQTYEERN